MPVRLALEHAREGPESLCHRRTPSASRKHLGCAPRPEHPNISSLIHHTAARLLRAHGEPHAGITPTCVIAGAVIIGDCERPEVTAISSGVRQTEIEHLDRAVRADFDVRRFEITMNDAFACAASSASAIWSRSATPGRVGCPAPRSASLPLDEFHHEGLDAIGVLEPVNGCDIRVIQRGKDFRLALKPGEPLGVGRKGFGQDFQRHVALERCLGRGRPRPSRRRR